MLAELERAADLLFERRQAGGHWEGRLSSSALATATAVTALATAARAGVSIARADALVNDGIHWLVATRNADGGWGDTPDSPSNISTTALAWAAASFGSRPVVAAAEAGAADWLARAAGGSEPHHLAGALARRYGKDRTFSVPILTMCAIAGRLGAEASAWRLIPPLPFELAAFPRAMFSVLRLPVVSYALPALITMGVARHRRAPAPVPLYQTRELAVPRVLRVLDTLQPPNGGFLEAVPLTSFVVMSLVAAGEAAHPVVRRGADFLVKAARHDGSWPIDTNLATWITTLAVNALASGPLATSRTPEHRREIRDWLLGQQWTAVHPYTGAAPGGWAWTDLPGGVPDADDTAGALIALAHLDAEDPEVRRAAAAGVQWLLDLQNRDGGMPTFCRGWGTLPFDRSATDLTAHALRAWDTWRVRLDPATGVRLDAALARGLDFLERGQRPDGAFVPLWFGNQREGAEENPVFGTSRVLQALTTLNGRWHARAQTIAARARAYLLAAQNEDGGWGGGPGVPSSIEETAVVLGALAAYDDDQAIDRGVWWLRRATENFTRFPSSPLGLYFAKLWYAEDLYALLFTTGALNRLALRSSAIRSEEAEC